ncbi:MAG: baseplate J/gp47 family protein [Aquabacterium sp.]|nr:baseplate J/gp47 family protein [Aquabacterium sp.]
MFNRPSLGDIVQRVRTDVLSRLSTDDVLRRADAEVYARVMGGVAHGLYGFIEWLSNQLLYDTAEVEYLERWCSIWGLTRKAAAAATGSVTFTVQAGAVIPSGTLLQALDGVQYQTTAGATVAGTSATAPVAAVVAAGASNRVTGQSLSLVSPVVGVQSTATAGALTGGADVETDDALRARLLARIQQPPQGGAASDYTTWALEVAGVTRAWLYPAELGFGTVTVRFVRDLDATLIPDAGEVATVQAYINARRPVTAQVTVLAPTAVPLNFSISGLLPATAAVQAAVHAELRDLLLREATPGGTMLLSHLRAAISAATGETDYVLVSPAANVTNTTGNMSTMGTITWL